MLRFCYFSPSLSIMVLNEFRVSVELWFYYHEDLHSCMDGVLASAARLFPKVYLYGLEKDQKHVFRLPDLESWTPTLCILVTKVFYFSQTFSEIGPDTCNRRRRHQDLFVSHDFWYVVDGHHYTSDDNVLRLWIVGFLSPLLGGGPLEKKPRYLLLADKITVKDKDPIESTFDSAVRVLGAGLGINYGQIANNLPSPSRVAVMLQSLNVSRLKLYDADPNVLLAFSNSNVEFVIGLGNEYLQDMTDPIKAQNWVQQHLQPHIAQTKITCITVGNEVFMSNDTQLWSNLLPAMKMVHNTLVDLGLDKQVIVTSAHSFNIIGNSYPPSSGTFRQDLAEYIQAILNFHSQINSPFLINAYPFFAYKDNPNQISLDYVLFQPNPGMIDPNTNLHYDNMLYAQVDAVYSAIKAMGHTDIEVMISETGWPSKGDPDEVGSTPENAALYHSNLLNRIQARQGMVYLQLGDPRYVRA
ncbi:hypothetical protein D5086_009373 [Populus alba]|uniref:Uncharacterized protein n=1 Tax=Populus alba TaxID=43335 RepID=A0ACC4CJ61_POPAL